MPVSVLSQKFIVSVGQPILDASWPTGQLNPQESGFAGLKACPTGNSLSSTLLQTDGRIYQAQIASSLLSEIPVGSILTGAAWRLFMTLPSFPTAAITFTYYEITLAQAANSISSFSTTFAANMTNPQLVRDGPLTVQAGGFPGGSTPNAWGPLLSFTTPYTYQGGDLVMMVSLGPRDGEDPSYLDSIGAGSASYGSLYTARMQFLGDTAVYPGDFAITQFEYASGVPEPTTLTLAGIGLLTVLALSRRRKG